MRETLCILFLFLASCGLKSPPGLEAGRGGCLEQVPEMQNLTPEEERVIVGKGTEPPFTGEYDMHFEKGLYACRRCGAALFRSEDKFDSGCGWPAFDAGAKGAVERRPDSDGMRTEILCAACGGHLGHVFEGEKLTPSDTRYCVNSVSLRFKPDPAARPGRAVFAAGCFWGVEYHMKRAEGVLSTTSGFTGGTKENPGYKDVCGGGTGHAEAVEVVFDEARTSFEKLAKLFFEIHDFTQAGGQGPDLGSQYRSAVYWSGPEQKETAERIAAELRKRGFDVKTEIAPAGAFWPAEDLYQDYYDRKGGTPYCHVRKRIFD